MLPAGGSLCARPSPDALAAAERLVEAGERSMRALLEAATDLQWAGPRMWGAMVGESVFLDLDTPEDPAGPGGAQPDVER